MKRKTIIELGATVVAGCGIVALGAMSSFISDRNEREYDLRQARHDAEVYKMLYLESIKEALDLSSENDKLHERIEEYENGCCLIIPLKETED